MKILVSSINFSPDHAGIAVYSSDLPRFLAEQGHNVTIVTGFPYYPSWKKREEDRAKLLAEEEIDGLRVLRGYLFVPKRPTAITRMLHEASFCAFAAINFLRSRRQERIVIFSPPFLLVAVGYIFSRLWRCPLVVNVQDIPIQAAMGLRLIKPNLFYRLALQFETWLYARANLIVTISTGMLESLKKQNVPSHLLRIVPNWIDLAKAEQKPSHNSFRLSHSITTNAFVVAYAGNIGKKQGVELLLELAATLQNEANVIFVIAGEGSAKAELEAKASTLQLANVRFLPFLPHDSYISLLNAVDLVFVAQRSGSGDVFFPSKLLGIMAQGRPMLVNAANESELAKVVRECRCGLTFDYADIDGSRQAIIAMTKNPERLEALGRNGLNQVRQFDRQIVLGEFANMIAKL